MTTCFLFSHRVITEILTLFLLNSLIIILLVSKNDALVAFYVQKGRVQNFTIYGQYSSSVQSKVLKALHLILTAYRRQGCIYMFFLSLSIENMKPWWRSKKTEKNDFKISLSTLCKDVTKNVRTELGRTWWFLNHISTQSEVKQQALKHPSRFTGCIVLVVLYCIAFIALTRVIASAGMEILV